MPRRSLGISATSLPPAHTPPQALGPGSKALGLNQGRTTSGQPPGWFAKADAMKAAGLRSLSPKEAQSAMGKGWLLVDVSPEEEYAAYHAAGSVNVPAVKIGAGPEDNAVTSLRGALFSSQGVQATYENPNFVAEVKAAKAKAGAQGVIFCCAYGGTLTASVNFPDGQASRSLLAAAKLIMDEKETAATVAHLRGGTPTWFKDGLPGEGADEEWDPKRGRMPTVGGPQWEQDNAELKR